MIILDTSAVIEFLLALPKAKQVQACVERVDWQIAAPELLGVEVLHVLRRSDLLVGRTGEQCQKCSISIRRIMIGGGTSHFCPRCQWRWAACFDSRLGVDDARSLGWLDACGSRFSPTP